MLFPCSSATAEMDRTATFGVALKLLNPRVQNKLRRTRLRDRVRSTGTKSVLVSASATDAAVGIPRIKTSFEC